MLQYSWLHFCTVHEMNLNATVWSSTFELFKMPINFNSSQFKFFPLGILHFIWHRNLSIFKFKQNLNKLICP